MPALSLRQSGRVGTVARLRWRSLSGRPPILGTGDDLALPANVHTVWLFVVPSGGIATLNMVKTTYFRPTFSFEPVEFSVHMRPD